MNPTALPDRAPATPARALPAPLSTWLADRFLPLWVARARADGRPGYVEAVRGDGLALPTQPRSTLVTARLVYTFSLGHALTEGAGCREAAEHGLAFLLDTCRREDGRFAHLPRRDDGPPAAEADLYDLAFVLLALAGHAGAFGGDDLLALTGEIAADLDRRLAHPDGGYRDPGVVGTRRRQFPHMHLFEAFQILARLQPGAGWERRGEAIVDLVERQLIAADGSIAEWYGPDWHPVADAARAGCEIGHQFEWAWLLHRHGRTAGAVRAAELGDRLYRFGIAAAAIGTAGLGGPLPNAIDGAGRPIGERRPLWPLTELLRASLATEMAGGAGAAEARRLADRTAQLLFEHHLDPSTGLWINETDSNGRPMGDEIPLRVLYHLVPAFAAYSQAREGAFATDSPLFDGGGAPADRRHLASDPRWR